MSEPTNEDARKALRTLSVKRAQLLQMLADARGSDDATVIGNILSDVSVTTVALRSTDQVGFSDTELSALTRYMVGVSDLPRAELARALVVIGVSEALEQVRLAEVLLMEHLVGQA